MNTTSTKSNHNKVVAYGIVVENLKKTFHSRTSDFDYRQLVIETSFHDLYTDKVIKCLHATNVWAEDLKPICDDIQLGDLVEVESYVESERNKKDPTLFFHKINAIKIEKK
jgi:hypothetical protein